MKWQVAIACMGFSTVALADAAVPAPKRGAGERGDGKPGWVGQCAERLERARDEAAHLDDLLKQATVEATARERGEPGDPTAKVAVDVVQLLLVLGDGPVVNATLEPDPMARSANLPWHDGKLQGGLSRIRTDHGFAASYYLHLKPHNESAVAPILQRALDDCLRRAK